MSRRVEMDSTSQVTAQIQGRVGGGISGLVSFVTWAPITLPQELATGPGPAKCQTDQVLAVIVCCWVSAPVHSSKCWDPSDFFEWSLNLACSLQSGRTQTCLAASGLYCTHTSVTLCRSFGMQTASVTAEPYIGAACFCCGAGAVWDAGPKGFAKSRRATDWKEQQLELTAYTMKFLF